MRRRTITAVIAGSISTAALLALAVPGATTAAPPRCTVVMGASIADGYRADPGTNWPTVVDQRLTARNPRGCIRNRSVSATRLLLSLPQLPSYLEREPAVLQAPQPSEIVLTDLINDIQALPHQYDPTTIIAGIRRFVAAAHQHGIRVVATTITPYGGYRYTAEQSYSTAGEHCRQAVNAALRQGGLVDGVIDFDRALADPAHPSQLRLAYDSGDHLHPSTAGQQAMADTAAAALQRTTEPSEVTRSYNGWPVPGTPAPALPPGAGGQDRRIRERDGLSAGRDGGYAGQEDFHSGEELLTVVMVVEPRGRLLHDRVRVVLRPLCRKSRQVCLAIRVASRPPGPGGVLRCRAEDVVDQG